jgi:hypothetical protein
MVADTDHLVTARTALKLPIDDIEIPFPQRAVNLKASAAYQADDAAATGTGKGDATSRRHAG